MAQLFKRLGSQPKISKKKKKEKEKKKKKEKMLSTMADNRLSIHQFTLLESSHDITSGKLFTWPHGMSCRENAGTLQTT